MELLRSPLLTADDEDPPIAVASQADHLVVEVRRLLDLGGTEALAEVLAAAVVARIPIRLDLATAPSTSVPTRIATGERRWSPGDPAPAMAAVVGGPGIVHLVRPGSCWTLDVSGRRLCRSTTRLQPRFIPAEHWTPISQLWLDGWTMIAVSPCGGVQFSEWAEPCGPPHPANGATGAGDAAAALPVVELAPRRWTA